MRHIRVSSLLSLVATMLIIGGVLYLAVPTINDSLVQAAGTAQNPAILASTPHRPSPSLGTPVAIELPRLDIRLAVKPAAYNNGWPLNYKDAFYITNSRMPIIYGHAVKEVFLPLGGIAKDELLRATNKSGEIHLFSYVRDRVVTPDQVGILTETRPNTLILMTCTGIYFENRRLLEFKHIGVAS